ncbi:hypothetical protein OESDEN_08556 [Oesophagostomum dentatum]|uniref:Uncharacterized protein n=1 Tax=Oesophagostomum dentatum TaxID=61180 RepID=A0A0B1T212_OESDE|nr:hypothetical protein OESDEN_08556 [Oesophagostomum dentatum]
MLRLIACLLVPLALAQYSTSQQQTATVSVPTQAIPLTASPSGSQSNSEPGYLPDYQGDRYTDPGRIKATQDLNRPFFDALGYRPPLPRETPAQSGQSSQTGGQYTQGGYGTNIGGGVSPYNGGQSGGSSGIGGGVRPYGAGQSGNGGAIGGGAMPYGMSPSYSTSGTFSNGNQQLQAMSSSSQGGIYRSANGCQ